MCDASHAYHLRSRIHDDARSRAAWKEWYVSLTQSQRNRYFFGLSRVKPPRHPPAHIIRPDIFHPEQARLRREQAQIRAWAICTGRDPIESPLFQARLQHVKQALRDLEGRQAPQNDPIGETKE